MPKTTSEWIDILKAMVEKHGDLPLVISAGGFAYIPMEVDVIFDAASGEPSIDVECEFE